MSKANFSLGTAKELAPDRLDWTDPEGTRLACYRWMRGSAQSDTSLVLVHGHGEHMERYSSFVSRLDIPLPVIGYDHRGHGLSVGSRGDAIGIDQLADDLNEIIPFLLKETGTSRCLLFGHSMGGLIVARFLTNQTSDISRVKGAIISAPAFHVHRTPLINLKIAVGRILAKIWPTLTFRTGLDPNAISRDPAMIEEYRLDPLVHDKISARFGRSLIDDGEATALRGKQVRTPILIYHGTADRIASIDGTQKFASGVSKSLAEYRELPGFYHEPHHEPTDYSDEAFAILRSWIMKQLKA